MPWAPFIGALFPQSNPHRVNSLFKPSLYLYFALFFVSSAGLPLMQAHANLDDSANLRILSAQSKALTINADYFAEILRSVEAPTTKADLAEELQGKTDCGSVAIGNQYTETSFSNEVTIIIVGDITNVGNVCTQ